MIDEYRRRFDYQFKIVLCGSSGVGKTALIQRYCQDTFKLDLVSTLGVAFYIKTLEIQTKKIKIDIWDTGGQEQYRSIVSTYYKGSDGIIMVYDVTERKSFEEIDKFWIKQVEDSVGDDVERLFLGNKIDLEHQRNVTQKEALDYANKNNMKYLEVSAKTNDQVPEAFMLMIQKLMAKNNLQQKQQGLKIDQQENNQKNEKNWFCC